MNEHFSPRRLVSKGDILKYREIIEMIKDDGWFLDRTVGSHQQYRHPAKPGTVTVPSGGKLANDIPPGTLNSILRQAGLKGKP